jgi:protease IV
MTLRSKIKLTLAVIVFSTLTFSFGVIVGMMDDEVYGTISDGRCNIAVVPLVGAMTTFDGGTWSDVDFEDVFLVSADHVLEKIDQARRDRNIKGVLVRIDSGGGMPVAGEMIANELERLSKPSVALIRTAGVSSALLASTGADVTIASRFADVGGIGITMSYLDRSRKNTLDGLEFISLTSAPFKDYMDPDRPLDDAERALAERDLQILHDEFVRQVAENREMDLEVVEALADGSSMPGSLALEHGLIDQLGDQETAREWFARELDLPPWEVEFCK